MNYDPIKPEILTDPDAWMKEPPILECERVESDRDSMYME